MSFMEKSGRAKISFQLMDRMREEGIAPNVPIQLFMLECFDIKILNPNAGNYSKYKNERENRGGVKVDVEYLKGREC